MKRLFLSIFIFISIVAVLFLSGYRFTAKSAVEAHSFLNKGSTFVSVVKSHLGDVYIYRVDDYYVTILPEKRGLLWVAPSSGSTKDINDKSDKVRTIGWVSYTSSKISGTVMVIEVNDENVSFIEAGSTDERVKKKVEKGKCVVYEWNKAYYPHNVSPVALSQNGSELYMYSYDPATPYFTDTKELRWYKIQ
jgi:hypothetical protein